MFRIWKPNEQNIIAKMLKNSPLARCFCCSLLSKCYPLSKSPHTRRVSCLLPYTFLITSAVPVLNDAEYEDEKETTDAKAQAAVASGATTVGVVGITVDGIRIAAPVAATQTAVVLAPATVAATTTAATVVGANAGSTGDNIGASVAVSMCVSGV